jgi:hypothetical protein
MDIKEGDAIMYKILDEESYSRGYGICYETKTSKVREVLYRMENGDLISVRNIQMLEEDKEPKNKTQTKK